MTMPDSVQVVNSASTNVLATGFRRRAFHDSALSTTVASGQAAIAHSDSKPFVALDERFLALAGPKPTIRVLCAKDYSFAHEAGVYDPDHDAVWVTSNLLDKAKHGTAVEIHRIDLNTGEAVLADIPGVVAGNGGCCFDKGVLWCDQGGLDQPSQLTWYDRASGSTRPLLNNFHGRPFNSLNDVIVLPPPGVSLHDATTSRIAGSTVWFTDPPYGYEQTFRPSPQLPPQVYAWDPHTGNVRVVADGFQHPNGIAFSPDGQVCYITDTSHIHGSGKLDPSLPSTIYAFDVVRSKASPHPGIGLTNKRVFAFADCGVPDGIKCDVLGNVYAGCGDGLHIWDPEGTLLGKIVLAFCDGNLGAGCANFCFCPGGRIAIFSENRVYLVEGWAVGGDGVA